MNVMSKNLIKDILMLWALPLCYSTEETKKTIYKDINDPWVCS